MDSQPSMPDDELLLENHQNFALIEHLFNARRNLLDAERQALTDGSHPKYLEVIDRAQQRFEHRRMEEQSRMFEQEVKGRISYECDEEIRSMEREHAKKLSELTEALYNEQEEQKQSLESDINDIDIANPPLENGEDLSANHYLIGQNQKHSQNSNIGQGTAHHHAGGTTNSGKKFLRRRPNDFVSGSVASITESSGILAGSSQTDGGGVGFKRRNQAKKGGSPFMFAGFGGGVGSNVSSGIAGSGSSAGLTVQHLLSETLIAEDVYLIGNKLSHSHGIEGGFGSEGSGGTAGIPRGPLPGCSSGGEMGEEHDESVKHHRKVALELNKLILDGKTFHRYQAVYIDLKSGRMPATIRLIREGQYVEFRSTIPGDTRQVAATKDDLESGRVFVRKRY